MKPLVIKVGGTFLEHPNYHTDFFAHVKALQKNRPVVLVHGGGSLVQALFDKLGKTTQKQDGLRVTPKDDMPYIAAALAGQCSTALLSAALQNQITATAITLADGNITYCTLDNAELGQVGTPHQGTPDFLNALLDLNVLPIINSVGATQTGDLANVNADHAATIIAQLIGADLLLLSDVPGVLNADKQLLPTLNIEEFTQYVENGVITDGMIVKVQAALDTASQLSAPVIIGAWQNTQALMSGDLTGFGTTIYPQQQTETA